MSEIRDNLKYTKSHEWVRIESGSKVVTVGITDYAQENLGDLVFVELPELGQVIEAGDECTVVESVKAASDVYSPITGEIIEVNPAVVDKPELINLHPYEEGWLFKIQLAEDDDSLENLLTAAEYAEVLAEDSEEEEEEEE